MGGRKHQSAIDAAALMIHKVHKIWKDKQIAGALLMDVKGHLIMSLEQNWCKEWLTLVLMTI